ncbi:argininosuccinate lyase [Bacillus sp. H-16]|uniref:argininosuccinate lyase n=1 Tax=Alteribacter salitolerans TaxID=2912333 RepID=UPI001965BD5E|nr:argininosuccinate lyase [Alteribacter salitolerans]MBM7095733.1 argininosuccinate lyase [Alteribacter salitolerans]
MTSRSPLYIQDTLNPLFDFTKEHFYSYIMEVNLAHVMMLNSTKILSDKDAGTILEATLALKRKGYEKEYNPQFEDLFFMIEHDLAQEIGDDLVGNMHLAFSRNDMDTTIFRMLWRQKTAEWIDKLIDMRTLLLELAEEHKHTIMPAHTHNQQAQPTTLAHYLLAAEQNLKRDTERGIALYDRINVSPMGACALSTTGFPIDRQQISDQLGFSSPMTNSYDAISASDFMLEFGSALSISLSTLSRFVYDLMFMATSEVSTLKLNDQHVQTSSIMPQKRNPSALEHTRASISKAIGNLQSCFTVAHSIPLGDIVDIGDDIQPVLMSGFTSANNILSILNEILENATFEKETLYERTREGFSTVTELADVLVRNHHISFRSAHKVVSSLVSHLNREDSDIRSGDARLVCTIAKETIGADLSLTEEEYKKAIDPTSFIEVRNVKGGPSPHAVKEQIKECKTKADKDSEWVMETFHSLRDYASRLEKSAELCVKNNYSV